jgi:hypothetical protein
VLSYDIIVHVTQLFSNPCFHVSTVNYYNIFSAFNHIIMFNVGRIHWLRHFQVVPSLTAIITEMIVDRSLCHTSLKCIIEFEISIFTSIIFFSNK